MNQEQLDALNEYFNKVLDIYKNAATCCDYAFCLYNPTDDSHNKAIEKFSALSVCRFTLERVAVMELCKLFHKSNSNIYNFHKFLNKTIHGEYGLEYKGDAQLIMWQKKLLDIQPKIDLIIGLRDSVFAHLDSPTKIKKLEKVEFTDVHFLLNVAYELICFLLNDFFPDRVFFYNRDDEPMKELLEKLST